VNKYFYWVLDFVDCPTHEKHEIKCPMNKNDFTVACNHSFTSPYSAAGYSSGGQGYGGQERERRSSWKAPKRKAPKSTGESLV